MLTRDHLDTAVFRGIINAETRDKLIAIAAGDDPAADDARDASIDENIRLVGGGNDLFVTIGVVMVLSGLTAAMMTVAAWPPATTFGLLALAIWGIAEFVTRQHRMRLSSTVLALAFVLAVQAVLTPLVLDGFGVKTPETPLDLIGMRPVLGLAGTAFIGGIALSAILHFWRFRVPVMAGVLALCVTAFAFFHGTLFLYDGVTEGRVAVPVMADLPEMIRDALYIPLGAGLLVFAAGVVLDLRDRTRQTIWSDCAFWLHVVSAPLIVHPLFIMATGQDVVVGRIEPGTSALVLLSALIALFVYVALAIDRRSLLLPTLGYFGSIGIYYLVNGAANQTGIPPFALILLAVGAMVMIFGAGWQRIRALIVARTLPTSVLDRLPPIKVNPA